MPEAERVFLLLAGHMYNELNSLNKVFAWCLHNQGKHSPIESLADGVQAQLYARLLAGKLLEAWNALVTAFFGAKIARRIEASLHPAAKEGLSKLKTYFGTSNLIFRVRNSFAFHYTAAEFERHWLKVVDNPHFEIILGGTIGNNLDLASELVVNTTIWNSSSQQDQSAVLQTFLDEVQSTASHFTAFLEGAILALLDSPVQPPLVSQCSTEAIEPRFSFEDVVIPYFYDHRLGDA
jgi:hypothetical protein